MKQVALINLPLLSIHLEHSVNGWSLSWVTVAWLGCDGFEKLTTIFHFFITVLSLKNINYRILNTHLHRHKTFNIRHSHTDCQSPSFELSFYKKLWPDETLLLSITVLLQLFAEKPFLSHLNVVLNLCLYLYLGIARLYCFNNWLNCPVQCSSMKFKGVFFDQD